MVEGACTIGFITSDKWLEVSYGIPLQKFFLDNFKIIAIIGFDSGVFEDADINTCITIVEREENKIARDSNDVQFIRLKRGIDLVALLQVLQEKGFLENETLRRMTVRQEPLYSQGKLSLYLKAPSLYWRILSSNTLVEISQLASIKRGITTGANRFFLPPKEDVDMWKIEKEYLQPAITNPHNHRKILLQSKELSEQFLMCHETKEKLRDKRALAYVNWGERVEFTPKQGESKGKRVKGFNNIPSVQGRAKWYDLGTHHPAPIVALKRYDTNFRCLWNKPNALASNAFYNICPKDQKKYDLSACVPELDTSAVFD